MAEDTTSENDQEQGGGEEPTKPKVLSLIDEKPKRRRRRKGTAEEEASEPEEPAGKTVAQQKKEALSLFEDSEKSRRPEGGARRKILDESEIEKRKGGRDVLPPISRIRAEEEEAATAAAAAVTALFTKPAAEAAAPAPPEGAADPDAEADGEPAPGGGGEDAEGGAGGEGGAEAGAEDPNIIHIKPPIIVKDLAERMGIKPFVLIKDLIELDVFADTNKAIEPDIAAKVCEKHGFVFEKERREKGAGVHKVEEIVEEPPPPEEEEEDELKARPPIVTFMGHVDHGKTSLLDAIRKTKVTTGEAGGITQHVAAYSVDHDGRVITFIDTPGHAAFSEMRARGADVTDIVVLVVAADDGIMPQTEEAIDHARAAGVKIIVALNKCDLEAANPDRVKAQLQEHDLSPEDWGGSTSVVPVSALKGEGIDDLLEVILLESEMLELKANPDAPARAPVIEARIEPGKGPTATVIVQSGTLRQGIPFICGPFHGKIKLLLDDRGKPVKEAGLSTAVEVLGFSELPNVGDELVEMESERAAKKLGEERVEERRKKKLEVPKRSKLEQLFAEGTGKPVLRLVIKTDVQGSSEAIVGALKEIQTAKIRLEFLHTAAGAITESDILLASASDAIVIGFNTKVESNAVRTAKREGVQIKLFSIIYELIDTVKEAMLGKLAPEHRETVLGHAEIKQIFKLAKGRVGGSLVTDGRIVRKARARVVRDGTPVYDGGIVTLRRFQDEVEEVRNGLECGIRLGDFNDYEVGDIVECYELEKLAQTL